MKDLKGLKINNLEVLEYEGKKKSRNYWKCKCNCGKIFIAKEYNILNDVTKSCGCYRRKRMKNLNRKFKHTSGENRRLYQCWLDMKKRCYDKKNKEFHNYGKRGIEVCDEWKKSFDNFYEWSLKNGYNNSLTLDRINVNKNYEPNNCRWATLKIQANNKRTNIKVEYKGVIYSSIAELTREVKIPYSTIQSKLKENKEVFINGERVRICK